GRAGAARGSYPEGRHRGADRRACGHGPQCGPYRENQEARTMSILADVIAANEKYRAFVRDQIGRARSDAKTREELLARWNEIRNGISTTTTPTGMKIPRLAVPETDEPGEIARYLYEEGLPGDFPYLNCAYREIYLAPSNGAASKAEEPTRLFAGLGLAEDTNARFHYL